MLPPQIRRDLFPVRHILEKRLHPETLSSPTEDTFTTIPRRPLEGEQPVPGTPQTTAQNEERK